MARTMAVFAINERILGRSPVAVDEVLVQACTDLLGANQPSATAIIGAIRIVAVLPTERPREREGTVRSRNLSPKNSIVKKQAHINLGLGTAVGAGKMWS